jgi:hypothetical protein
MGEFPRWPIKTPTAAHNARHGSIRCRLEQTRRFIEMTMAVVTGMPASLSPPLLRCSRSWGSSCGSAPPGHRLRMIRR